MNRAHSGLLRNIAAGLLLGMLSMAWLTKSAGLIVDNARCCLFATEGDGRRGMFFAAVAVSIQIATLVVAFRVVQGKSRRTALALVGLFLTISVVIMLDARTNDAVGWLNLLALVVAGLAIALPGRRPPARPSADPRGKHTTLEPS